MSSIGYRSASITTGEMPLRRALVLLWILAATWAAALSAVQLLQHASLMTGGRDLGLFDHALSSTLRGRFLHTSLLPPSARNYFGFHFCPILLVFLPLYALHDGPEILLVGQAVVMALAVLPLFAVARRRIGPGRALLLCATYLFYRAVTRAAACTYHQETFFPLFFFFAAAGLFAWRSRAVFWTGIGLALLTKEDVGVYLLPVAALMVLTRTYRRTGLILGAVSAAYFLAVNAWIVPMVSSGGATEWPEHFRGYGATPGAILLHAATHPVQLLRDVLDGQTLRTAAEFLLLLGLLPLGSAASLGAITPAFACFLSQLPVQRTLGIYYGATVFPYLFLGSVFAIERILRRSEGRRWARWVMPYLVVLLLVNIGNSSFVQWVKPARWAGRTRAAEARPILALLPANAHAEVQNCLLPQLRPLDRQLTIFPENPAAEYVLTFEGADPWPLDEAALARRIAELSADPTVVCVAENGRCRLWRRRTMPENRSP